jgi:drug/metabolite transporter (DMT)-like permease
MQALWMVLGAFLFATMSVVVKIASEWFNSGEMVLGRGLIGIVFLWLLARARGVSLATRYPGMHAWRSTIGVVSLGAWFYAIAHMPLATAVTLNYMSSVWVAAFLVGGALLAWVPVPGRDGRVERPPLQGALAMTVLAGFVGVVLMLKPSVSGDESFAGMLGLLSGLTAAFAYMQVVALSRIGEPELRTVFYFADNSA